MKDKDIKPIEGDMDFITFKELVEEVTGSSFETVYKDWVNQGVINEQGNME